MAGSGSDFTLKFGDNANPWATELKTSLEPGIAAVNGLREALEQYDGAVGKVRNGGSPLGNLFGQLDQTANKLETLGSQLGTSFEKIVNSVGQLTVEIRTALDALSVGGRKVAADNVRASRAAQTSSGDDASGKKAQENLTSTVTTARTASRAVARVAALNGTLATSAVAAGDAILTLSKNIRDLTKAAGETSGKVADGGLQPQVVHIHGTVQAGSTNGSGQTISVSPTGRPSANAATEPPRRDPILTPERRANELAVPGSYRLDRKGGQRETVSGYTQPGETYNDYFARRGQNSAALNRVRGSVRQASSARVGDDDLSKQYDAIQKLIGRPGLEQLIGNPILRNVNGPPTASQVKAAVDGAIPRRGTGTGRFVPSATLTERQYNQVPAALEDYKQRQADFERLAKQHVETTLGKNPLETFAIGKQPEKTVVGTNADFRRIIQERDRAIEESGQSDVVGGDTGRHLRAQGDAAEEERIAEGAAQAGAYGDYRRQTTEGRRRSRARNEGREYVPTEEETPLEAPSKATKSAIESVNSADIEATRQATRANLRAQVDAASSMSELGKLAGPIRAAIGGSIPPSEHQRAQSSLAEAQSQLLDLRDEKNQPLKEVTPDSRATVEVDGKRVPNPKFAPGPDEHTVESAAAINAKVAQARADAQARIDAAKAKVEETRPPDQLTALRSQFQQALITGPPVAAGGGGGRKPPNIPPTSGANLEPEEPEDFSTRAEGASRGRKKVRGTVASETDIAPIMNALEPGIRQIIEEIREQLKTAAPGSGERNDLLGQAGDAFSQSAYYKAQANLPNPTKNRRADIRDILQLPRDGQGLDEATKIYSDGGLTARRQAALAAQSGRSGGAGGGASGMTDEQRARAHSIMNAPGQSPAQRLAALKEYAAEEALGKVYQDNTKTLDQYVAAEGRRQQSGDASARVATREAVASRPPTLNTSLFGEKGFAANQLRHLGLGIENTIGYSLVFTGFDKLQELVHTGLESDAAMVRLQASLNATGKSAGNLRSALAGISASTATPLENVIEAASELNGVFNSTADLEFGTKIAAQLANISQGTLTAKEAAVGLRDVIDAYSQDWAKAGISSTQAIQQTGDQIAHLSQTTGVNVNDILEGTTQFAQEAHDYHLNEGQAATIAAYASRATGESGEESAAQASRFLATLNNPNLQKILTTTGQVNDDGTTKRDAGGSIVPIATKEQFASGDVSGVLATLLSQYDKLAPSSRAAIQQISGVGIQARVFSAIMHDGTQILADWNDASEAQGALAQQNASYLHTVAGEIKQLDEDFQNLGNTFARLHLFDLLGIAAEAADKLFKAINTLGNGLATFAGGSALTKQLLPVVAILAELKVASLAFGGIGATILGRAGILAPVGQRVSTSGREVENDFGRLSLKRLTRGTPAIAEDAVLDAGLLTNVRTGRGGLAGRGSRIGGAFARGGRNVVTGIRDLPGIFAPSTRSIGPMTAEQDAQLNRQYNPGLLQGGFYASGSSGSRLGTYAAQRGEASSTEAESALRRQRGLGPEEELGATTASQRRNAVVRERFVQGQAAGISEEARGRGATVIRGANGRFTSVAAGALSQAEGRTQGKLAQAVAKTGVAAEQAATKGMGALSAALGSGAAKMIGFGLAIAAIGILVESIMSTLSSHNAAYKTGQTALASLDGSANAETDPNAPVLPGDANSPLQKAGKVATSDASLGHFVTDLFAGDVNYGSGKKDVSESYNSDYISLVNLNKAKLKQAQNAGGSSDDVAKSQKEYDDFFAANVDKIVQEAGGKDQQTEAIAEMAKLKQDQDEQWNHRFLVSQGIKDIDVLTSQQITNLAAFVTSISGLSTRTLSELPGIQKLLIDQTTAAAGSQSGDNAQLAAGIVPDDLKDDPRFKGGRVTEQQRRQAQIDIDKGLVEQDTAVVAQDTKTGGTYASSGAAGQAKLAEAAQIAAQYQQLEQANDQDNVAYDQAGADYATKQGRSGDAITALTAVQTDLKAQLDKTPITDAAYYTLLGQLQDTQLAIAQAKYAASNAAQSVLAAGSNDPVVKANAQLKIAQNNLAAQTEAGQAAGLTGADLDQFTAQQQADVASSGLASRSSNFEQSQAQNAANASGHRNTQQVARDAEAAAAAAEKAYGKGGSLANPTEYANAVVQYAQARNQLNDAIEQDSESTLDVAAAIAKLHGDDVGAAQDNYIKAQKAYSYAVAQFGANSSQANSAFASQIQAQQEAIASALAQEQSAIDLQITQLTNRGQAGDKEAAANLGVTKAQQALASYQNNGGVAGTAESNNLVGAVGTAQRNAFDVALQAQLDTLDFQKETYAITGSQEVAALQQILQNKQLTLDEQRSIILKIKDLQDSIRAQLTQGGLNIPSDIQLPTAYEIRRSLGSGFAGGVSSAAIVTNNNQQVTFTVNQTLPTAAVAAAVAAQVIAMLNQQTGASVRANTTTPRLVPTG